MLFIIIKNLEDNDNRQRIVRQEKNSTKIVILNRDGLN